PFPVEMNVRAWHLFVVGVAVRRPTEVQLGKNDDAARAVLIRPFGKVDLAARNIQHEPLALVGTLQGYVNATSQPWVVVQRVVDAVFLHREENLRFDLSKIDVSHEMIGQTSSTFSTSSP